MNKSKDLPDDANVHLETETLSRKHEKLDPRDPYVLALRDLRRKRAEIDAAIQAILLLRPELQRDPEL